MHELGAPVSRLPSLDQLVATGFVRCNMTTDEGGVILDEVKTALVRDRVETFGTVFLGLTVGCAACHDHKFDPITQKEFYQISAALGGTYQGDERESLADAFAGRSR